MNMRNYQHMLKPEYGFVLISLTALLVTYYLSKDLPDDDDFAADDLPEDVQNEKKAEETYFMLWSR